MKKFLIIFVIFLVFFEFTSFIITKLNLFISNETPIYFKKKTNHSEWLTVDNKGYPKHFSNFTTKHFSKCINVQYEFNNIGSRDNEDYFFKDEKKSILLIGDSFAFGYGVDKNEIFANIIEKKINKKVLNFGISGSDPRSHLYNYLNSYSKFNFDEIIYFFLPHNDFISEKNKDQEITHQTDNFFTFKNIKFYLKNFFSNFSYSYNFFRSAKIILDIKKTNEYESESYFIQDKTKVRYTLGIIEEMIKFKDVKTYIVIIPSIYDINNFQKSNVNYKNLFWYKEFLQLSNKNNIVLIDLLDYVDFKNKYLYFLNCDGHWNSFGNNFAAEVFLNFYKKIN